MLNKNADLSVSVIIPAYNAEPWIGQALESVLALDYPADLMEIMVLDDGSSDATAEAATRALRASPAPWCVHTCARGGPGRARNLGVKLTSGKWIQFLDADDGLAKNKLSQQIRVAGRAESAVAVVYSTWDTLVLQEGAWIPARKARKPIIGKDPVADLLRSENFIATGSQLVNRTWFEKVRGFDEGRRCVEDVNLALRIAISGGLFVGCDSEAPLFFYRQHSGSLSHRDRVAFARGCADNARLAEAHWRRVYGILNPEQRVLLLQIYGHALRVLYARDREGFSALLVHVEELEPGYVPSEPRRLRQLARWIGYQPAEAVAFGYRQVKDWVAK